MAWSSHAGMGGIIMPRGSRRGMNPRCTVRTASRPLAGAKGGGQLRRAALCPPSAAPTLHVVAISRRRPEAGARAAAAEGAFSRTQRIMEAIPLDDGEVGGAGGVFTYRSLKQRDEAWYRLRHMATGGAAGPAPEFVRRVPGPYQQASTSMPEGGPTAAGQGITHDVAVCGGTLGIFIAAALAKAGKSVIVVERGKLQGQFPAACGALIHDLQRAQDWNISRKELLELVEMGVFEEAELEDIISIEFNPNRCGFKGGPDFWVKNILNLGVSPRKLVQRAKERFLEWGGTVLESTELHGISVFDDVAVLSVADQGPVKARLVLDAMGNFSPIVRQIRWGMRPDGVCLVVGGCARGFPAEKNRSSDVIYSDSDIAIIGGSPCQLFWEAFPAGSGPTDRTTYLFTYVDADPNRPSLEQLLEEYWDRMPAYQGVSLDALQFRRVLFGFFPTYRDSPLQARFDRVLQVGDASGIQSPLSFGGFGSITRHLKRLSGAIVSALDSNLLTSQDLALINPYQPNLSGAWLLQRAMSPPASGRPPDPHFINALLSANFGAMEKLGDPVMRPFLQDVTQFGPLALTMGSMVVSRPDLLPGIFRLVGLVPLLDWLAHFVALGSYSAACSLLKAPLLSWAETLPPAERFYWERQMEAWEYGAGLDYKL